MLPAILARADGDPFGPDQRLEVTGQGGAIHSDLFRQARVTHLAGTGDIGEERVLRNRKTLEREHGVVKGGEFSGYFADLGANAGTKLWGIQLLMKRFLHRCRCTCLLFNIHTPEDNQNGEARKQEPISGEQPAIRQECAPGVMCPARSDGWHPPEPWEPATHQKK